ncbi:hypothetical protein SO694_00010338 [Aureococcus anophagefferens]|uniref:Uncharacterized protein n=1 Tax=Aureococcus anophagefferens TaxID=44056 RepID=A0ABR1GFR1_AURAN
MELSFEIQLQYHAPARVDGKKRVLHARRDVDRQTTWDDVGAWAAATSTYAARAFALEDENGAPAAAIRVSPLAWIKQDQQRRPFRTVVLKRHGCDDDETFERSDVVASAHVGLVSNTINSGVDTTTMLSESIENSVQHNATVVEIAVVRDEGKILIFDDGDGIPPELVEAIAKPGASTVRDDSIQEPVKGPLKSAAGVPLSYISREPVAARRSVAAGRGSRPFGALDAPWGRYGVGRFSQLHGTTTQVRFTSVAKGVAKVVVFAQDMAKMIHKKQIEYDYADYRHGSREAALEIKRVNTVFGKKLNDAHFTCVEITNVGSAFFEDWDANRDTHLAHLAEKYVLHTAGAAGDAARSWLEALGVLPEAAATRRLCGLVVDGADLGVSGATVGGAVANKVADAALFARSRDDAERLARVTALGLDDADGAETLYPWFARPREAKGRRNDARLDEKIDSRVTNLLFLESTRLFAPEIHKRHLRDKDEGYRALREPREADAHLKRLRKLEVEQRLEWTKAFDEDENYPHTEDSSYVMDFRGDGILRRCGKLLYRGKDLASGLHVSYEIKGPGKKAPELGFGRVVAFFCDAQDATAPGFFVAASPLLPSGDVDFPCDAADLERLEDAGPGAWWHESFVACPSAAIVDVVGGDDAVKEAAKKFPAKVHALRCGEHDVPKAEQAWKASAFDDFTNTMYSHTTVPPLVFALTTKTTKKGLQAADVELELVAQPPSGDEVVVATAPCVDGAFALEKPEPLDAVGVWELFARVRCAPGKIWTRLCDVEREGRKAAKAPLSLDQLCKRDDPDCMRRGEPAFSRSLAVKLQPSEPLELRVELKGKRRRDQHVELGGDLEPLVITFHDARGAEVDEDSMRVKPGDFDVRGGATRVWLEVDGNEVDLDASRAKLESGKAGELVLRGVAVPEGAVPPGGSLPRDVRLHASLEPVVEGSWTWVTYRPVPGGYAAASGGRGAGFGETFPDLAALEAAVNARPAHWIVPRTVDGLETAISAAPARVALVEPESLDGLAPRAFVTVGLELTAASGHRLEDFEGYDFEVGVVDKRGGGARVHAQMGHDKSDDGVLRQKVRLEAPFGWSGTLRFAVQGCECFADASTIDRALAVKTLTAEGLADAPDGGDARWTAPAGGGLGAFDASELHHTWLRAEVVDGDGAVDASFPVATVALYLRLAGGETCKFFTPAALEDGAAVFNLSALVTRPAGPVVAERERGAFALVAVVKEADGDKATLLETDAMALTLKAGAPASLEVAPQEALAVGDAARPWAVAIRDECGADASGGDPFVATLSCDDARATLEATPTALVRDAATGAWTLPGGWRVRGRFVGEDAGSGTSARVDVALTLARGGVSLDAVCALNLIPGAITEVRADGSAPSLSRGARFQSPKWTCFDACGNRCVNGMAEISCTLALDNSDNHSGVPCELAAYRKKKKKKAGADVAPPAGVVDEAGVVSFGELVIDTAGGAPLPKRAKAILTPQSPDFSDSVQVDPVAVYVDPIDRPVALTVYRRSEAGVGEAFLEGEVGGWGDTTVTELADGAVVEVPAGEDVWDHVAFVAVDEAGQRARPDAVEAPLRFKAGGKGSWQHVQKLRETSKTTWFQRSSPDAPAALEFTLDGGGKHAATHATIHVARVPGEARRIVLERAPTAASHSLLSVSQDDDTPAPAASARYYVSAFDGDDAGAARCACAARATVDLDDTFGESEQITTLTQADAPIGVEIRSWPEGDDPDRFKLRAYPADGVALALAPDARTVVEVRLVDRTDNRRAIDGVYLGVTLKLFRHGHEDDVDGVMNVNTVFPLGLTNDKARASRDGDLRAKREALDAKRRDIAEEQALEGRTDAPRRPARLSTNAGREAKLDDFRARFQRRLRRDGIEDHCVGFLSELATIDDDGDAKCVAALCGNNMLYVTSGARRAAAQQAVARPPAASSSTSSTCARRRLRLRAHRARAGRRARRTAAAGRAKDEPPKFEFSSARGGVEQRRAAIAAELESARRDAAADDGDDGDDDDDARRTTACPRRTSRPPRRGSTRRRRRSRNSRRSSTASANPQNRRGPPNGPRPVAAARREKRAVAPSNRKRPRDADATDDEDEPPPESIAL